MGLREKHKINTKHSVGIPEGIYSSKKKENQIHNQLIPKKPEQNRNNLYNMKKRRNSVYNKEKKNNKKETPHKPT